MKHYKLIVVGGGSAGLAAAIKAHENGISNTDILIIEKSSFLGGILNQCIHTGFGLSEFKEELTGPEYAYRFVKKIKEYKISYVLNSMVVSINENRTIEVSSEAGFFVYSFDALILTTGCIERGAGSIKLPGDRPVGIFTAGQAQNYLNSFGYLPGKKVFILGSGDIGLIMARRMTLEGAKVLGVAEIMPYSNGLKRNIVQCLDDFDIPLYLSTTVSNVYGKKRLERIELCKVDENMNFIKGTETIIECDTLLLSVGLAPNINLLSKLDLKYNDNGKLIINEKCETSMNGIFVCGNSLHVHDLVDEVTKESRIAGFYAAKYIKDIKNNDINNNDINNNDTVMVIHNNAISYVMPNVISINNSDPITLRFRVKKPLNSIEIIISDAKSIIKRIKKPFLIPSEMQSIVLDLKNRIDSFLKVEIINND